MKKLHAWALVVAIAVLASFVYAQVSAGPAGPGPRASGFQRLLPTNTADTSSGITAGRTTTFQPSAEGFVPMGAIDGPRARGFELIGFGTGTGDLVVEVWGTDPGVAGRPGSGSSVVDDWDLQLMGTATFTLGTSTGAVGATVVTSSEKIAHQVAWSPTAFGTAVFNAYAGGITPQVYTPGSNGQARLLYPDCGNAFGIRLRVYNSTTTTANAAVKTGT